jgi:hypothetical protein
MLQTGPALGWTESEQELRKIQLLDLVVSRGHGAPQTVNLTQEAT